MCVVDLCAGSSACGGHGECEMVSATTFACECTGNYDGPTCGSCKEGYAGPTCSTCATNAHEVEGACILDRAITTCRLAAPQVWAEPNSTTSVFASVEVAGLTSQVGPLPAITGRLCWRSGTISALVDFEDLACVPMVFDADGQADSYRAELMFPTLGTYRMVAAFSGDGDETFTFCDTAGVVGQTVNAGLATVYNIDNGGFEEADSPLMSWTADNGLDAEAEDVFVHSGDRAVRLTRVTTNNAEADFTAGAIEVTPGRAYTFSMWFWDNDPNARANLVYAFFDASDVQIGATSFGGVYTGDGVSWQNISRTVTAPANAARVRVSTRVYTQSGGTPTGGSVVLDDVAIIPAP